MLDELLKSTWIFRKAEKVKDLLLEALARIEARQVEHEAALRQHAEATAEQATATAEQVSALRSHAAADVAALSRRLLELEGAIAASGELVAGRIDRLSATVIRQPGTLDLRPGDEEEPELGLVAHLAPLLPRRVALDIGANVGKYSEALLDAGFEVHAFEPNPSVAAQLRERLGARKGFTAHAMALGAEAGTLPLHLLKDSSPEHHWGDTTELATITRHALPDTLSYSGTVEVPVRRLEDLQRDGLVPTDVGYVKVDTEGFDLEVVRGMGPHRSPLISVEFWDKDLPFAGSGALNALPDLASALQERGYPWWIVIYRVFPEHTARFYSNVTKSVERSWGNAFFFQDHALFQEAEHWCAAVMPRTFFTSSRFRDRIAIHS